MLRRILIGIRNHQFENLLLSKAALTGSIYTVFLGWTVYSGVPVSESIYSIAAFTIQTLIGLVILPHLARLSLSTLETFAVAFAVGSMVSTVIDQLFVSLDIDGSPWAAHISLLLVLITMRKRNVAVFVPAPQVFDFRLLAITPVAIMSGYGIFSRGWWYALVFIVVASLFTFKRQILRSGNRICALVQLGVLGWLFTLFTLRPAMSTYGNWLLRPLYTGSDDLVFSESLSWSLSHFGINDHAAAVGISVRYHWFSLAWSGLIDKMVSDTPFVTTLHIVPTITFMVISWLIPALTSLVGYRRSVGATAVLILFGTASVIDPSRFFFVLNTSNVVPFIWILLVPIGLILHHQMALRGSIIIIPLLVGVVFLAKAPYGLAVLLGVLFSLILTSLRDRSIQSLLLLVCTLLSAVSTYLVFLSPHTWERRQFTISWKLANLASNSALYPLVPLILIACILATLLIGSLGIVGKHVSRSEEVLLVFLYSTALVGTVRFILSGGSAELYFFNLTVFCSAILSGIGLISEIEKIPRSQIAVPVFIGAIAFFAMKFGIDSNLLTQITSQQAAMITLPIAIAVALTSIVKIAERFLPFCREVPLRGLFIIATLAASSSVLFDILIKPEEYVSNVEVISVEDVSALSWLRVTSPESAIIATNRFLCASTEPCSFDDSSFLISAVARRRVLVEGPRFVIGGRPYPQWMTDRIALSTRFAEKPNEDDLRTLKDYGVDWFVVSERFLPTGTLVESDWAKFGSIRYRQDGITIIELRS